MAADPAFAVPSPGPMSATARGVAYGAGAGALWGLVFLAPKLAGDFSPLQLAAGRYLCFGAIAAALLAPRWRRVLPHVSRSEWLQQAWLSFVGNTLHFLLLSSAVQLGGVAMASLVVGFLPVTVTIIGARDADAPPLRRLAPSLAWCAAGLACIGWQSLGGTSASGAKPLLGLLCALGALATWTLFAVGNARCIKRLVHVSAADWNLLTGLVTGAQALLLVPLAIVFGSGVHANADWLRLGAVVAGLALFASIAGNALWNRMSRLLPLTLVGQMILFQTVFALVYGLAWEARWPTTLELASLAMVVMGVVSCVAAHGPRRVDAVTRD